jgi:hypothetical protein
MNTAEALPAVVQAPTQIDDARSLVQVIERAATNPSVDIDKMERLLQMHERITERQARAAYAAALARLQPKLPIIAERGAITGKTGGVQSRYALWEDIVGIITPILASEGFSLSFRTGNDAGGVTVTGVLTHAAGHAEATSLTLPIDTSGSKNAVQSVGSSTAYGKRYTAAALLNLRSGEVDDDGQAGPGGFITEQQAADLAALIDEVGADRNRFVKYLGVATIEALPATKYTAAVKALEAKRKKS